MVNILPFGGVRTTWSWIRLKLWRWQLTSGEAPGHCPPSPYLLKLCLLWKPSSFLNPLSPRMESGCPTSNIIISSSRWWTEPIQEVQPAAGAADSVPCNKIQPILCSSIIFWFGLPTKQDRNQPQQKVRTAMKIICANLPFIQDPTCYNLSSQNSASQNTQTHNSFFPKARATSCQQSSNTKTSTHSHYRSYF